MFAFFATDISDAGIFFQLILRRVTITASDFESDCQLKGNKQELYDTKRDYTLLEISHVHKFSP